MKTKVQFTGLYTILYHELVRMFRISIQVFLPSMITTLLYFMIFGAIIGKRVGLVEGVSYSEYIAPGLVMIAVINNAYSNVSASLFSARFQRSIEEVLISPLSQGFMLLGYTLAGVVRGLLVALLVLFVSACFIPLSLKQLPLTLFIVVLISSLFSLAGFTNGMLAKTFDDVAVIPTFVLSPLTYLGGVFYSVDMLAPFWHHIALMNPIFYMVDLLRFAMLNTTGHHVMGAMVFIILIIVGMAYLNLNLLKRGVGIRE